MLLISIPKPALAIIPLLSSTQSRFLPMAITATTVPRQRSGLFPVKHLVRVRVTARVFRLLRRVRVPPIFAATATATAGRSGRTDSSRPYRRAVVRQCGVTCEICSLIDDLLYLVDSALLLLQLKTPVDFPVVLPLLLGRRRMPSRRWTAQIS